MLFIHIFFSDCVLIDSYNANSTINLIINISLKDKKDTVTMSLLKEMIENNCDIYAFHTCDIYCISSVFQLGACYAHKSVIVMIYTL